MHWNDEAIVLSTRKHGETSVVARLFTPAHGVHAGVLKGSQSKANRGIMQPGNRINVVWQARLSEQLGNFKPELLMPNAALIMQDGMKLTALSSACAMVESFMPERHPYPRIYDEFELLLAALRDSDDWTQAYVQFELVLLSESGFGLDLSRCAATGTKEDLIYVSPKSGRAVSRDAGAPYADKMLLLPAFLVGNMQINDVSNAEILAGLRLTGYFLEHWLAEPHGKKLPAARSRLTTIMKENHGAQNSTA